MESTELLGDEAMATPEVSSYGPVATNEAFTTHSEDDVPETASLLSEPLLSSDPDSASSTMVQVGKQGAIVLLCLINLINYIDRGIIPGAPEKFNQFITDTLGVSVLRQSVYFGLLTSAFIASYSIFSMVFGYFALTHRPFRIIALGMTVWVVAVAICGMAQAAESYYVLIAGRLISGILMIGFIICCLTIVPDELNQIPINEVDREEIESKQSELAVVPHTPGDEDKASATAYLEDKDRNLRKPSFFLEWWGIFSNVPFMLIILGHAAYTFSLAAMSTFSPAIFIGLGLFESETTVSLMFGGLVAITGTIGTPLGGILVDYLAKKNPNEVGRRCMISVYALFYFMLAAVVFGLIMVAFASTKMLCLVFLTLCLFFMCALSVPETIAVLELFPKSRQSMAVAANTLIIHALGDVPSPIVLGAIKDSWAPHCGTVEIDGEAELNPDCSEDYAGLRDVLLFAVVWLAWGVMLWGASVIVVKRRQKEAKRRVARGGVVDGLL
ncbi:Major Facilitator Superfamily (MFS) [Phytophthora nicotianae]|uniref:Major Facilitator Superfamily (MFS) n=1 Tax=Phytophthora nicotianae TaxID=4792 RepID=A0A0W8C0X8_PHYNI|nr:Major Facilitator Superfamily (MFS) [Phytophthora nicotianae]